MEKKIVLDSGFEFDFSKLLGEGLVEEKEIESISEKIKQAHEAIEVMRKDCFIKGHLSKDGEPEKVCFAKLPYITNNGINTPQRIKALKDWGESLRYNFDAVISLGIGGSFLGNKVIFDIMGGEFWNYKTPEERDGRPEYYFSGNNLDPHRTTDLLKTLTLKAEQKVKHTGKKFKIMLVVISKSGSTIETMANFFVIKEYLENKNELFEVDVTAITDLREDEKETILHKIAKANEWQMFSVPDGVGGRFSIFSEVGLSTGVVLGFDIEKFLEGARDMDQACKSADVYKNPALMNAVLKFLASENHGRDIEVMMPYADYLKSMSEWYIQLLAESLGKKYNRKGEVVYYGRTPIVAVGTTDMHAQTQQHQEGKLDKVVQFIEIRNWKNDIEIHNPYKEFEKLEALDGIMMSEALNAALESNAEALISEGRYSAKFVLPELNEYYLGQLLYLLALTVAYEGELADVDAFNQPGVEAYKKLLGPKLKEIKQRKNR